MNDNCIHVEGSFIHCCGCVAYGNLAMANMLSIFIQKSMKPRLSSQLGIVMIYDNYKG